MEYIYLTRHKKDQSVMVEKKRKKQISSLAAFEKSFLFGFGNRVFAQKGRLAKRGIFSLLVIFQVGVFAQKGNLEKKLF